MRAIIASLILLFLAAPCHAQILKNLAKEFMSPQDQQAQATPAPTTQPSSQVQVAPMVQPPPMQLAVPNLSNAQGVLTGTTALPPGYYSITNMQTQQSFYLSVSPGGQTFAIDPRTVQSFSPPVSAQQSQAPAGAPQDDPSATPQSMKQQAVSKIGAAAKSTLTNYLQNKFAPAAAPGTVAPATAH